MLNKNQRSFKNFIKLVNDYKIRVQTVHNIYITKIKNKEKLITFTRDCDDKA